MNPSLAPVVRTSLPLIFAQLAFAVNTFVTQFFLARHSTIALHASLPGAMLAVTLSAFFINTLGYAGTMIAQRHGSGDEAAADAIFSGAVLLTFISIPLFALTAPLGLALLGIFDTNPAVFAAEAAYFKVLLVNGYFTAFAAVLGGYFTGRARTKLVGATQLFGCDCIGIGGIFNYKPFTTENLKRFTDDFAPAIEKITKAGKQFLYHNHKFEFEKLASGELLFEFIMNSSPDLKLTFDTYWAQAGGVDPAARIEAWKDKIAVTHFKDMRIESDVQKFAAVGEGNMNFDRIVEACKKAGIKYHMVEQDSVPEGEDPFDCLATSYKNVMARYGADFE